MYEFDKIIYSSLSFPHLIFRLIKRIRPKVTV